MNSTQQEQTNESFNTNHSQKTVSIFRTSETRF